MYPHFFDAETLGESLKEVATDIIKAGDTDIVHRWFHSAKDADFFLWLDKQNNVIKQQITFYGQVVEWNIVEGVKTGLIVEDETKSARKASDIIRFDGKVQKAPVDQALKLLKHMTALNDLERHTFARNFEQGPTHKTLDPEEFVRRYGSMMPANAAGDSTVRRLFDWIRRLFSRQS